MEMRKFKYSKLVRDKILSSMQAAGEQAVTRKLSIEELKNELIKKIDEEVEELRIEKGKPLDSLVDLQEVIDSLLYACGITKEELAAAQDAKREKSGSFNEGIFIDEVDIPATNEWVYYLEQHPDKYPEIKN